MTKCDTIRRRQSDSCQVFTDEFRFSIDLRLENTQVLTSFNEPINSVSNSDQREKNQFDITDGYFLLSDENHLTWVVMSLLDWSLVQHPIPLTSQQQQQCKINIIFTYFSFYSFSVSLLRSFIHLCECWKVQHKYKEKLARINVGIYS